MAVALLIAVSHPALGIVFLFLVPFWFVWRLLQDCACASSARLANLFPSLHFFGSGLAHPRLHEFFIPTATFLSHAPPTLVRSLSPRNLHLPDKAN